MIANADQVSLLRLVKQRRLGGRLQQRLIVGLASVLLATFGAVCGAFDNPIPSAVHELQALLAGIIVVSVASWAVAARLSGRWWRLAVASAAATVALPTVLLLTQLTVASWAPVGFCSM
ncbi:MAG: hypothetical protein QOJ11_2611 [Frankiales bacterium]|jgi:hypothetical protein|nr:hypothetical protein [Frankiales bacterium]